MKLGRSNHVSDAELIPTRLPSVRGEFMKINVRELAAGPQELRVLCQPDVVGLNDTDLVFEGPVTGEIRFSHVDHNRVLAQGEVRARLNFQCARCLEPASTIVVAPFMAVYEAHPELEKAEVDPFAGPEDNLFALFDGESIHPEPEIREALMMEVPDFPICKPDCKGLCPTCGGSLNAADCGCGKKKPDGALQQALKKLSLNQSE